MPRRGLEPEPLRTEGAAEPVLAGAGSRARDGSEKISVRGPGQRGRGIAQRGARTGQCCGSVRADRAAGKQISGSVMGAALLTCLFDAIFVCHLRDVPRWPRSVTRALEGFNFVVSDEYAFD